MTPLPAPPRRRADVPLLVFLAVVVLAVAGSGVTVGVGVSSRQKPTDVARAYLQALADADAARALSFTSSTPVDTTLLTDGVLAASRQRAPLTDVAVTAEPGSDEVVDVSYRLGDRPVTDRYSLSRVSGVWKLDKVSVPVSFMPLFDARIPVVVNGTAVDSQATEAFPVSYAVTTGLPGVDWGADSTASVTLDGGAGPLTLEPRLTDRGRKEFVAGARKVVGACVAQRKLAPSGCPFGFRQPTSGPRIPDSTVRWRLKGDPWTHLPAPVIDSATDPGHARTQTRMTFTNTCRFSTGEACRAEDQTRDVILVGDVGAEPIRVELSAY